jgi:LemA protein
METPIIVTVVVVLLLILVILFNNLIRKKNNVENIFGSLDANLKKRFDLIPNLISSVQAYMAHEKGTLLGLTELRAKALNPNITQAEKVELHNKITHSMNGMMVAAEDYPELKANENFLHLQASMNEVEEQISAGRRAYNAAVTEYNNAIETIPSNLVALLMGYKRKPVFDIPDAERKNINVKQLFTT